MQSTGEKDITWMKNTFDWIFKSLLLGISSVAVAVVTNISDKMDKYMINDAKQDMKIEWLQEDSKKHESDIRDLQGRYFVKPEEITIKNGRR